MQFTGIVQKGRQTASALGFPTLNIPLGEADISGIYVARVTVEKKEYEAVAYANRKTKQLEAHLLDFSSDLYGAEISITLLEKLREGIAFKDDEEARAAIANDVEAARAYFRRVG